MTPLVGLLSPLGVLRLRAEPIAVRTDAAAASGQVKIYSRNCEDRTAAYPDVVQQIREAAAGG